MPDFRRFDLDELTVRPGTYFNPVTEVLIVVDDSADVDTEMFEDVAADEAQWVLVADDTPVDEERRDDLIEAFHLRHQSGGPLDDGDDVEDDEEERPVVPEGEEEA
jgi:hypothetical protein